MKLTQEILNSGKSDNGGYSSAQVECFGLSWPLESGWKSKILGQDFPDDKIERFVSLKNSHLTVLSDKQLLEKSHKYFFEQIPTDELRAECPFELPEDEYYRVGREIQDADEMRRHLMRDFAL